MLSRKNLAQEVIKMYRDNRQISLAEFQSPFGELNEKKSVGTNCEHDTVGKVRRTVCRTLLRRQRCDCKTVSDGNGLTNHQANNGAFRR